MWSRLRYHPDVPKQLRLADLPASSTLEEFWEVLGSMEHEQLEFKSSASSAVSTTVAAMAMSEGGLILLGIDDARKVIGCPLDQGTQDVVRRAANTIGVDVQMREVLAGRSRVTVIAVPQIRGRVVTTTDGRLVRRSGSDNQPLVGDALARFVVQRSGHSSEDEAIPVISMDEFDLELVNKALVDDGKKAIRRGDLMRGLIDLGVAIPTAPPADPKVTVAAVLLFASHPQRFCPAAVVQVVRRTGVGPGPGPTAARLQLSGPLPALVDRVLDVLATNTTSHEAVIGRHRERVPEYPTTVLREGVLNALAHRDYGLAGASVDITIWDDRIEIRSPGPLPGHITLDNMREEHYSRNQKIMRVLKVLGLVEEYGEGVDRMFRDLADRLMEPPAFAATNSSLTVTVHSRSLLSVEDQAWLALLAHLELTPHERRILVLARREGTVTRRAVKALIPDADPQSLLAGTVAKGLLVMNGERGGAYYQLSDEVVMRVGAASLEARNRQRQTLLDALRRREGLSTADAMEVLQEPNPTLVRHLLNDLARAGLAVAKGRTRARRYFRA